MCYVRKGVFFFKEAKIARGNGMKIKLQQQIVLLIFIGRTVS